MSGTLAPWFERRGLALLTDLYQLTMMAAQWRAGRAERRVSFDYFFRDLPPHGGYAVTAGLESLLKYLEHLRFEEDDLDYLGTLGLFDDDFLRYMRDFRPRYNVRAMPEGTLAFPFEPVVQVEGTIFETQFIETALLNVLNYQTLIATKAARICFAAEGDAVLEFGLRRAHGPDGGVSGSRAAYIGGCVSSSNVLAGKVYGIPVAGTHAHSWVMSFESELDAFVTFGRQYPERCVLLVDTYDTVSSGVPNAIRAFKQLWDEGVPVRPAIRLDSGDLAKLSKIAYDMMREAGIEDPMIVASNDLDEDLIADLKRQGARINAWGVGTKLITAEDQPSLGGVYKLVAVESDDGWAPRMKLSSNLNKATDPGRKRLMRYYDGAGHPLGDMMAEAGETLPDDGRIWGRVRTLPHKRASVRGAQRAEDLLQPMMEDGARVRPAEDIGTVRTRVQTQLAHLPDEYKRLRNPEIYNVLLSPQLGDVKEQLLAQLEPA